MITRTITNIGDPFVDGFGDPIVGAEISFTLINASGTMTDGWDTLTGERISPGPVIATTNINGEFSIDLWPTSRADQVLYWYCSSDVLNVTAFKNSLTEGTPLTWLAFRYNTVDPFELQSLLWLQVKALLVSSGYEFIGDYDTDNPLTITKINQVFTHDGEYWRPTTELSLPYTTINDWDNDVDNFVNIGDLVLRQDLYAPAGSGLIGFDATENYPANTIGAKLKSLTNGQTGTFITFDNKRITFTLGIITLVEDI